MGQLVRKSKHTLEEIFEHVERGVSKEDGVRVDFGGDVMKMGSLRYQVFKYKGCKCVKCGIEGKFFAKEKHTGSKQEVYHFNLYAIDQDGNEIMMTKDHIIAKSKGGTDCLDNLQTMCSICNGLKGDGL